MLTKVKVNKVSLEARKEWLKNNSRCSEVLDSEFYYQVLPSLDLVIFDIDNKFLKEREIKAIDTMKPDSRYLHMVAIGHSLPRLDYAELKDYRNKYGCSKGVTRNENLVISPNKCASFGKVKSYGSITTVINSVGQGAQGSPCFNELGKCWGFIINSLTDIPEKWSTAVSRERQKQLYDEAELIKDIDRRIKQADTLSRNELKGKVLSKKDKKRLKKEKKKDKKHKSKIDKRSKRDSDNAQRLAANQKPVSDEYFDIKSEHCLIPLLP